MIDPVSAVMTATAAFNGIKRIVEAGQNVEQTFAQIGKWYGAVSDFNEAKRQMENPPLFKKLVATMSVEEEAINVYIQEKKIKEQLLQRRVKRKEQPLRQRHLSKTRHSRSERPRNGIQ